MRGEVLVSKPEGFEGIKLRCDNISMSEFRPFWLDEGSDGDSGRFTIWKPFGSLNRYAQEILSTKSVRAGYCSQ